MSFKKEIEKLIENNFKTYRDNYDRFIADYNRELELTKEYDGRQLLELLQNADDANANKVVIEINKSENTLIISNDGEAFTTNGVKSLMLPDLSPKTKLNYIGNKGLGFRSILNWADSICIYSNGCELTFSEKIAENAFNSIVPSKDNQIQIRNERGLSKGAIPFPILAIPKIDISENKGSEEWVTLIKINYKKKFEDHIISLLGEVKEEILLFLNHIEKISIIGLKEDVREFTSKKTKTKSHDIVFIKEKFWQVFTKEDELPDEFQDKTKSEKQSYSLKVAVQSDLSDDYFKLFNFFPTQVSISLPCIIHGTFELNSSRKQLNNPSDKNSYILKQLIELLKECAFYFTRLKVDWRSYKLLTPYNNHSDSDLIEVFYNDLEKLKKEIAIYPCISNQYRLLKDIVYYNDSFSIFFKNNFPSCLPEMLLPLGNEKKDHFNNKYEHKYLVEQIDNLSKTEITVSQRAELIALLTEIVTYKENVLWFSLLVNDAGKIINKDDIAFTPVIRSPENFKIPDSVKVYFMKSELYDLLISKFENTFDKKEPKSRELQRTIKSVVNIQPYDSNNVIEKIITGTKDALKGLNFIEEKTACIIEMIAALFANFKNIENRQEKLKISVPILSKTGQISDAEDLYLSKAYPSGKLTEVIYGDTLKANEYLPEINYWGLENEELSLVESFFIWLGINKFSKIESSIVVNRWSENNYFNFIFENGTDKPDDFDRGTLAKNTIFSKIQNFDQVQKLPISRLILLILKDEQIRQKLESNNERIDWLFTRWRPTIIPEHSYIRYQFITSNIFTKYILEEGGEELNKLINEDFQIDYEFLSQYGINKTEVKSILIKLGAKESFNEISPKNIYEILKAIPVKDLSKKGRATQTIYKMALESLVKQESNLPIPTDILFFSKKGAFEEYQPTNNVYYADNTILPRKILDTKFLLNLPKRSGEDNVERYFGVKSLREFKIEIKESNIFFSPINQEFAKLFETIKPFILTYRLSKIKTENIKNDEAKVLKNCNIQIIEKCFYNFGNEENMSVEEKEFINVKNQFYFKHSTVNSINDLKNDFKFCDAFAEMMCIIFKANELKNEFLHIFKYDPVFTSQLIISDFGEDKLNEAYQLLGISRVEIDFWINVFTLKGKNLLEPIENAEILKLRINEGIGIELSQEYNNVDFEYFTNKESFELVKKLSNELFLDVKQILPAGLFNWHKAQFTNTVKDLKYKFEQLLWLELKDLPKDQSNFIKILNTFNFSFIDAIEKDIQLLKYELEVDYSGILKDLIKQHFNINLNFTLSQNIIHDNLYSDLLETYAIEEVDISDEKIRSLLFFEGNKSTIEDYLKTNFPANNENDSNIGSEELNATGSIIDVSLTKNKKVILLNKSVNDNESWVHSGQINKNKKRKGKKAELLVYNTFIKQYGVENVKWVSGNSTTPDKNDKLHYDIEYKNNDGEWKYLEVKAISDDYFIFSNSEKEIGLFEPDKYEMALVKDMNIYIVKDLFKFENGECFENNSKFVAQAKDYILTFNIKNLNTD